MANPHKPARNTVNQNNIEDITFGVEIETTIPAAAAVPVGHYHAGAAATGARMPDGTQKAFPTFNGKHWKTERDGSIFITTAGHTACEFVSPVLKGEAGILHLIEFVEFLRDMGAAVNTSCGLHIHIGAASAAQTEEHADYLERLVRLVAFNSKALYAQTGTIAREKGHFCAPLGEATKRAIRRVKQTKCIGDAAGQVGRYHILNLTNLRSTGTVEFRCFAGTLNTNKVLLHLFSVLALCVIARNARTPAGWENKTITGTKAVTNFLKVRPIARMVGSPTLAARFPKMLAKALEMAAKYDAMTAAVDLAVLANRNA